MTVFIVERGEFCEGAVVCGVFSTITKALEYVGTYYPSNRWTAVGENRWEHGCDFVEINEYEVE